MQVHKRTLVYWNHARPPNKPHGFCGRRAPWKGKKLQRPSARHCQRQPGGPSVAFWNQRHKCQPAGFRLVGNTKALLLVAKGSIQPLLRFQWRKKLGVTTPRQTGRATVPKYIRYTICWSFADSPVSKWQTLKEKIKRERGRTEVQIYHVRFHNKRTAWRQKRGQLRKQTNLQANLAYLW